MKAAYVRRAPRAVYKRILVVLPFLALAALAACGRTNAPASPSGAAAAPATPTPVLTPVFTSNQGTVMDHSAFNTPQAMCDTPLVTAATIVQHGQPHWNTPSGQRPATLDSVTAQAQGYQIFTPIILSRLQVLADHRSVPAAEFVTLGGQIGPDDEQVQGLPQVVDGGRYVLVFLAATQAGTGASTPQTLLLYEAFPVDGNDIVTLQAPSVVQGVSYPGQTITLQNLAAQLASCR